MPTGTLVSAYRFRIVSANVQERFPPGAVRTSWLRWARMLVIEGDAIGCDACEFQPDRTAADCRRSETTTI
jgi:hypothetical protein